VTTFARFVGGDDTLPKFDAVCLGHCLNRSDPRRGGKNRSTQANTGVSAAGEKHLDANDDLSPEDRWNKRAHGEFQAKLLPALRTCVHAIDMLLFLHWRANSGLKSVEE